MTNSIDDRIQKHFERKANEHARTFGKIPSVKTCDAYNTYLAGCKRGLLIGTMLGIAERESIFNETMATARAQLEKLIAPEGEEK